MPSKYKLHPLPLERTFVMVKPDGVMRGLIGEVIKRLEQRGLKIVRLEMREPGFEHMDNFYPKDPVWIERLGTRGIDTFKEHGLDPVEGLGSDDPKVVGKQVRKALIDFMVMGPVVAMAVEGAHAASVVRKLIGATVPLHADPGTIRGDYTHDAPTLANVELRSIYNIVHASENREDAVKELAHWFPDAEYFDYDRADHVIMFGDRR
jgi:nucleoside-diphosphate kinase